jgi:hypothetical protein
MVSARFKIHPTFPCFLPVDQFLLFQTSLDQPSQNKVAWNARTKHFVGLPKKVSPMNKMKKISLMLLNELLMRGIIERRFVLFVID